MACLSMRNKGKEIGSAEVLIVLGAPNSPEGTLSPIARGRADLAVEEYLRRRCPIILTGGYGAGFNVSKEPHAAHVEKHLISKGVDTHDIILASMTSHTVDDAVHSKRIIDKFPNIEDINVVTSYFHIQRATLIFAKVFKAYRIVVLGAQANVSPAELELLEAHEQDALSRITAQGGVLLDHE